MINDLQIFIILIALVWMAYHLGKTSALKNTVKELAFCEGLLQEIRRLKIAEFQQTSDEFIIHWQDFPYEGNKDKATTRIRYSEGHLNVLTISPEGSPRLEK